MSGSPPPALSVIVVNRNTAHLLKKCLEKIYRSNLDCPMEVLVVDNGSSDGSCEIVREHFPRVILIEALTNLGFAKANNLAIARATGDFLALVNTDALLDSDCLGLLLVLMQACPQSGMVGPQLLNSDGSRQTSFEAVPTLTTEVFNRSLLKKLFPNRFPGKAHEWSTPAEVEALIGAVMMIRRSAFQKIKGFDEGFFFFLEETDLAVRLRSAGWTVMHHPRAKAFHLQGATAGKSRTSSRIEFYRSRYYFFRKHYGRARAGILKVVLTANLTLNVVFMGTALVATFGKAAKLAQAFRVRNSLWKWHLRGCPDGPGLPRN